jgi:hypothetical protein
MRVTIFSSLGDRSLQDGIRLTNFRFQGQPALNLLTITSGHRFGVDLARIDVENLVDMLNMWLKQTE